MFGRFFKGDQLRIRTLEAQLTAERARADSLSLELRREQLRNRPPRENFETAKRAAVQQHLLNDQEDIGKPETSAEVMAFQSGFRSVVDNKISENPYANMRAGGDPELQEQRERLIAFYDQGVLSAQRVSGRMPEEC